MEKSRKNQYLATLAVSIASSTTGFCSGWATPVISKFHDHTTGIDITTKEISWMIAVASIGYMTGSLLTRHTSDAFGRRSTILISAIPSIIGSIIILTCKTAWLLYVTRILWGMATGIVGTVAGVYIAEISDKEVRGQLSTMTRFAYNFGTLLVTAVGPFVSFQTLNYMILVMPICYFTACWFIPESPYYLIKKNKVDAARKALTMLTGNGDEKVLEDRLSAMRSHVRKEMLRSGTVKEFFTGKEYRKAIIIVIGIKLTQIWAGSLAIQQYLGRIIQETNMTIPESTALVLFGVVRFLVGIFSMIVVDKVGRRPLMFYSYLFSGITLGFVGATFFVNSDSKYLGLASFVGILLNAVIAAAGYSIIAYIIPTEIFPINIKSIAMTFANILGGFANFFSVKGYQEVKDIAGLSGVFWFYGSFAIAGSIFCYFFVPETKGKSLREIQMELQGIPIDEAGDGLNPNVENGNGDVQLKEVKHKDNST